MEFGDTFRSLGWKVVKNGCWSPDRGMSSQPTAWPGRRRDCGGLGAGAGCQLFQSHDCTNILRQIQSQWLLCQGLCAESPGQVCPGAVHGFVEQLAEATGDHVLLLPLVSADLRRDHYRSNAGSGGVQCGLRGEALHAPQEYGPVQTLQGLEWRLRWIHSVLGHVCEPGF